MFSEIPPLEILLDNLFPPRKLNPAPGKELLEATRVWSAKVQECSHVLGPMALTKEQTIRGSRLASRPVFICGVHRSGTTLLRDLLDGHPALTVLPSEGSFLTNFSAQLTRIPEEERENFLSTRWVRRLANPINQPPYWSLGRSTSTASPYVDFSRAFQSWWHFARQNLSPRNGFWPHLAAVLAHAVCSRESGAGLGASYWVDKTPTQEKYFRRVWHAMPEARFIHMIRSPADVLLSRKRMEPTLNLGICLRDMQASYKIAKEQSVKNRNKYLVVRYEDLCADPPSVISEIVRFLQIESDPVLFMPTVAGQAAHANSSFDISLPAGNILSSRSHSCPGTLAPGEERLLSAFLSGRASDMGYPLKSLSPLEATWIKIKFESERRLLHHHPFSAK